MPKRRRGYSSFERSRASPFPCSSNSRSRQPLPKSSEESKENIKEWDEALCPVCMEHPHNAVLLACSSHDKGCRPYMCNTSHRHSNCLDQFRKFTTETSATTPQQEETPFSTARSTRTMISEPIETNFQDERADEGSIMMDATPCESQAKPNLVCPLCRGRVSGWVVVESARRFMNSKSRSCACETCDFSGTYVDLRNHARLVHPLVQPTEADPERQRRWRRLERQRDLGDLISTLQLPIEDDGDEDSTLDEDITLDFADGSQRIVIVLIRVGEPESRAPARVSVRRPRRVNIWAAESNDGESMSSLRDNDNESSERPRSQRRHGGRVRHRQPTPDSSPSSS